MSPRILIGESTSSYPFSDVSYLYAPGIFMGKILFEKECPTQSPSNSIPPSFAPSNVASERYAYIISNFSLTRQRALNKFIPKFILKPI